MSKFYEKEVNKFQFHKGAIIRRGVIEAIPIINIFQFHKGAIIRSWMFSNSVMPIYFNSIKVQL